VRRHHDHAGSSKSAGGTQYDGERPRPDRRFVLIFGLDFSDPQLWLSLATLSALEIVLGIDNVIFIAITAEGLPEERRARARRWGLILALVVRFVLLAFAGWLIGLTEPIFSAFGFEVSWRDVVLGAGGLFLLAKATSEIHQTLEGAGLEEKRPVASSRRAISMVILQIVLLDIVFSVDSIITAVGMTDELLVMYAAVTIAIAVMLFASGPVAGFVTRHPTVRMLALAFLILIGIALIADGLHFHIPRGYLYFAIAFSILVESPTSSNRGVAAGGAKRGNQPTPYLERPCCNRSVTRASQWSPRPAANLRRDTFNGGTMTHIRTIAAASAAFLALTASADARDQIRIVGSSTVYPFTTVVAEQFGKSTKFKTPIIESTGTGGGFKLFCAGVGVNHPDISNASRRIKKSEVDQCAAAGVKDITEVQIGFDGIVFANAKSAPAYNFTLKQLYMGLAKSVPDAAGQNLVANPYKMWSDVDKSLPNIKIEVLGPPPTSGTRDAWVELAMDAGCETFPMLKAMKTSDPKKFQAACQGIREDGAYIEAGENDVLIVQKLVANPNAFGIFGYSFLDTNRDKVKGSPVGGVNPTFEAIADGKYPVSRPIYFYVKKAHVGVIPGIKEFVTEFTSPKAWGKDGYLVDKGLIPLPDAMAKKVGDQARMLAQLSM
jgi:phosphate transport system substrate-binding protein